MSLRLKYSWWYLLAAFAILFLILVGFRFDRLQLARDAVSGDTLVDHLTAAIFFRQSLLEGQQFPGWRDTIMAGQPFAGISLYKTAYPLQWLLLLLEPVSYLNVAFLLHMIIAGVGMACWARALGLAKAAQVFTVLAFVFAPKTIGHAAGHFDFIYALAWWPWLMYAVKRLVERPALSAALWLTLFAALMFLADIRLSFFGFSLALAYMIYETVRRKRVRTLGWGGVVLIGVVILTLSVTLPVLIWSPYISRNHLTLLDAANDSLPFELLIGTLVPLPGVTDVEWITYFGLPVLGLAIIAVLKDWRKHGFWLASIGVALLYALGIHTPFWTLLVRLFPLLLWFRVPARAWFVIAFVMPILAGYGLQVVMEFADQQFTPRRKTVLLGKRILRILVPTFGLIGVIIPLVAPLPFKYLVNLTLGFIVGGALTAYLGLRLLNRTIRPRTFLLLLLVCTFVDLGATGWARVQWRGVEVWLDPYQPLAERLVAENAYRVYSPTNSLPQHVAELYHLRLFGGISPFIFDGVVAAVSQGGGFPNTDYFIALPPDLTASESANINTAVLGEWGVTHVVAAYELHQPNLQLLDRINGVYVYANRDPALTIPAAELTHWPAGWPSLPSLATILLNEQTTLAAHVVSLTGFFGLILAVSLAAIRQRHARGAA